MSNNNGNKKSIRFLRGSVTYDPSISDEVLEDGQPFYSKMTKKLYIGDGVKSIKQLEGTYIGIDLTNLDDGTIYTQSNIRVDKAPEDDLDVVRLMDLNMISNNLEYATKDDIDDLWK